MAAKDTRRSRLDHPSAPPPFFPVKLQTRPDPLALPPSLGPLALSLSIRDDIRVRDSGMACSGADAKGRAWPVLRPQPPPHLPRLASLATDLELEAVVHA